MTIPQISHLDEKEKQLLIRTPALISVLIAGADEDIDEKEKDWAKKLVKYKRVTAPPLLQPYYEKVAESFEELLPQLVEVCGDNAKTRHQIIGNELNKLNEVLPKLDKEYAEALYKSWKNIAEHVAKSSGGFLGFGSISTEERALIDLPMIRAVD